MVSGHNLVTFSEDCNQSTAREGITDGDIVCAAVICEVCRLVIAL
jgi:hypothetical protein